MKILGIDTGSEQTGWVIYDTDTHSVLDKGVTENYEFLEKINYLDFDFSALEMVASYGMPVGATTFQTCVWIGRFIQKIENKFNVSHTVLSKDVYELLYKKVDINPILCGSNRAKDSNIRQALLDMFPANGGGKTPQVGTQSKPGNLYGVKSHIWAALAVAITYSLKHKLIQRQIF